MNKPLIISLSGKAGSGKDTVATIIEEELRSSRFRTYSLAFADHLKYQLEELGWDGVKDTRGRAFLQELADTVKHYHGESYYATETVQEIKSFGDTPNTVFIITDTRYKYELEALREVGHVLAIYVKRDFESTLTPKQTSHSSENSISEESLDYVIENHDLAELRYSVKILLDIIGIKYLED